MAAVAELSSEEILSSAKIGDLQTLRYAIDLIQDRIYYITDGDGLTCLHAACIGGQLAAVQILLYGVTSPENEVVIKRYPGIHSSLPANTTASSRPADESPRMVSNDSTQEPMDLAMFSLKGRSTQDHCLSAESDIHESAYNSTEESAAPTASSRVSTRSSDTNSLYSPVLKACLCPSCLVTRMLDTCSKKCLKCGEDLVEPVEPSNKNGRRKESPWASLVSRRGHTALHWAVLKGHSGIVRELLLSGFDPEAVSKQGCTPLKLADVKQNASCFDLLSQFKRDLSKSSKSKGRTKNHEDILKTLTPDTSTEESTDIQYEVFS